MPAQYGGIRSRTIACEEQGCLTGTPTFKTRFAYDSNLNLPSLHSMGIRAPRA